MDGLGDLMSYTKNVHLSTLQSVTHKGCSYGYISEVHVSKQVELAINVFDIIIASGIGPYIDRYIHSLLQSMDVMYIAHVCSPPPWHEHLLRHVLSKERLICVVQY